MALPPSAVLVPVLGTFIGENGKPLADQTILFTPRATVRKFTSDLITLVGKSVRITLDELGRVPGDTRLCATDDPNVIPFEWTWNVKEEWLGGRTYDIPLPVKDALIGVDLTLVSPEPASGGVGWERGPMGPAGPPGEGTTKWIAGNGPPPDVIPGAWPGDIYIDNLTGIYYKLV